VAGDVMDERSRRTAVSGADAVVQALTFPTSPVEKRSNGFTFDEFDHRGTARLVSASRGAGVRKFVYGSGSGAAAGAAEMWFRAKWAGDEAIRASGIEHAI